MKIDTVTRDFVADTEVFADVFNYYIYGGQQVIRPDPGEFLGGFWKEDRLIPSVTLTIYFGSDVWDGPLSLLEMMDTEDQELLSCMDDYHVRLIAPALMPDEEIMKFRSGLREVLLFIKYAKDKEKLGKVLEMEGTRFRAMERRAVDVIEAVTNMGLRFDEKEMKVDMCQAIREMRMESEQIGEARGEARGALKNAQENARSLYRLGVALETIAKGVGYDLETVKGWLGL